MPGLRGKLGIGLRHSRISVEIVALLYDVLSEALS
jgi:hypothetical protein